MTSAAIETRDLRKVFQDPERGEVEAVCGIDLECRYGEIYGLLGPNGAGKSTTLRILATILAPTSGSATVDGVDVAHEQLDRLHRLVRRDAQDHGAEHARGVARRRGARRRRLGEQAAKAWGRLRRAPVHERVVASRLPG